MRSRIKIRDREELLTVVEGSFGIVRHVEFFRWLQDEVSAFLPHDVLVAVWGDFTSGHLNYDVASNIPEIHTQQVVSGCDVDPLMRDLHRRWLDGDENWFVLDRHKPAGADIPAQGCINALERMRSVLVHGIRDRRGGNDCLYAFFAKDAPIKPDPATLNILVPHIDSALRRVECLAPIEPEGVAPGAPPEVISEREQEIMDWVTSGKTNQEIGLILNISPNTVKNHLKRIFQKLNVTCRAQAVAKYALMIRA